MNLKNLQGFPLLFFKDDPNQLILPLFSCKVFPPIPFSEPETEKEVGSKSWNFSRL